MAMNEKLMEKATFSEVCKILEHREGKSILRQCVIPLVELLALVIPGLTFAKPAEMDWIGDILDKGLTVLDASERCHSVVSRIKDALSKNEPDYVKRANDAFVAYILIVYVAYFEAAENLIPTVGQEIRFDGYAKWVITEKARKALQEQGCTEHNDWMSHELWIPGPAERMEDVKRDLLRFYELMNRTLDKYLMGLADFDKLDPVRKNLLSKIVMELPQKALLHYDALYLELSAAYPSFAIWTRQVEHTQIEMQIDRQGERNSAEHQQILKAVENIPQMIQEREAEQILDSLHEHNVNLIECPVIDSFEMPFEDEILTLPSRKYIFFPQTFSYHYFKEGRFFEQNLGWIEGKNLISFISHAVHNQAASKTPLLVLGGPGAGKTTLSQMLAGKYLCGIYHVIVIRLRDLGMNEAIYQDIRKQIDQSLMSLDCAGNWGQLMRTERKRPFLLIFDGYDELLLASGKEQKQFMKRIAKFQREAKTVVHAIVTSRITLIDQVHIPLGTTVIRLDGFDEEGINKWSEKWNDHNSEYFSKNGTKPLMVPNEGNVSELAKQPLLLLMLALYDAMEHSLQDDLELKQTQLYNKLIRRFIGREEKKKDEEFDEVDGKSAIDQEMERLGVTAVGMYNRDRVHIRREQLEQDLELMNVPKLSGHIGDGERLLRRFFFIHHIESENVTDGSYGAYEFLHNSFGEFLTAHYMVEQLSGVLKGPEPRNQWYASMSYVPLYIRPNVASLIQEWASISLNLTTETVKEWLYLEIDRVLRGEVVARIQEITGYYLRTEDEKKPVDLLFHAAVYACNLMCLGSLIMGQVDLVPLEEKSPGIWEKLLRLWQLGLGEDGMIKFSRVFEVDGVERPVFVFRNLFDGKEVRYNRDSDLEYLYSKLAIEPERSMMAAIKGGYGNMGTSDPREMMDTQDLPYVALMNLRSIFDAIASDSDVLSIMDFMDSDEFMRIIKYADSNHDEGALFGLHLVLKCFVESEPNDDTDILTSIVPWMCEYYYRTTSPLIRNLITDLLLITPKDRDTVYEITRIVEQFKPKLSDNKEWEYHNIVRLAEYILSADWEINDSYMFYDLLEVPINENFHISTETIPFLINIVEKMDQRKDVTIHEPNSAIEACIRALEYPVLNSQNCIQPEVIGGLLWLIWNRKWRNRSVFRDRIWTLAKERGITVGDVYRARPDLVEQMCCAEIGPESQTHEFRKEQLKELVYQCGGELALKHYKQIRELAKQTNDKELLKALGRI